MKGAGTRRRNRTSANSVSLHRRGKEGKQKIPRAEHNEEKTRVMKERSRHEGGTHLRTHIQRHLEPVCGLPPPCHTHTHTHAFYGQQIKREMPFQLWGDGRSQHTHTRIHTYTQTRRRVSRWALSQAAKQITSRYDIYRQADRGGRSVPAGREQQLTAPSPGISPPSWERERLRLKVRDRH